MRCFMGKEARRGLPTAHCWFLPASQTFSFTIFPTLRNLFCFDLGCPYSDTTKVISSARYPGPPGSPLFFPACEGLSSWVSFLCASKNFTAPPHSPATTLPIYLFRIMFSWKRWVVTLLYFLAKRKQVHFISIEGTLQSCHLERKKQNASETQRI